MGSTEDFMNGCWGLHPVLDVPELFPPAVMFSIRDSDPHAQFTEAVRRLSEKQSQHKVERPSSVTPEIMRQAMLRVAWDSVFHDVPGDKLGLLYQNESRHASTEGAHEEVAYAVMIKSNEPAGTKWLVTRATQFKGRSVCWCVPVNVQNGKSTEVALTVQNMITLEMQ
jgi:hypothetical protein